MAISEMMIAKLRATKHAWHTCSPHQARRNLVLFFILLLARFVAISGELSTFYTDCTQPLTNEVWGLYCSDGLRVAGARLPSKSTALGMSTVATCTQLVVTRPGSSGARLISGDTYAPGEVLEVAEVPNAGMLEVTSGTDDKAKFTPSAPSRGGQAALHVVFLSVLL